MRAEEKARKAAERARLAEEKRRAQVEEAVRKKEGRALAKRKHCASTLGDGDNAGNSGTGINFAHHVRTGSPDLEQLGQPAKRARIDSLDDKENSPTSGTPQPSTSLTIDPTGSSTQCYIPRPRPRYNPASENPSRGDNDQCIVHATALTPVIHS